MKAALAGLQELWDEAQYEEEYDVAKFTARLHQQGQGEGREGGGGESGGAGGGGAGRKRAG